ncbi:hypothetical protein RB596_005936 [Gaeumannomyces avenae]
MLIIVVFFFPFYVFFLFPFALPTFPPFLGWTSRHLPSQACLSPLLRGWAAGKTVAYHSYRCRAMSKRSWHDANTVISPAEEAPLTNQQQHPHSKMNTSSPSAASITVGRPASVRRDSAETRPPPHALPGPSHQPLMPQQVEISRKVKACAACRKQKIRCHMDQGSPPCRRCKERNLSCVLSKSLQMLMDERSQWHQDIISDLETLHASMQHMRDHSGLPPLQPLRSSLDRPGPDNLGSASVVAETHEEVGPSTDNSPKLMPQSEDGMPDVPMQSVYYLTKLRALRASEAMPDEMEQAGSRRQGSGHHGQSNGVGGGADMMAIHHGSNSASQAPNDFISEGQVQVADAQKLFQLYMERLDHFVYRIGRKWRTLDSLRRQSPVLTACILTVAALHDSSSNQIYPVCNNEFRRLVAGSVFDRRIDREHLRALCIASYWLSDVSWTLSGIAIRRATELNLVANYHRVVKAGGARGVSRSVSTPVATGSSEAIEEAADCMRIWYNLYICDKHLSVLYGRPSLVREDYAIQGWEQFLASTAATDHDRRLISQVALHIILTGVHELFGPDSGTAIPLVYSTQIATFSKQLDHWIAVWSVELKRNFEAIGEFPVKGALIHYHFAKLYLFSHVFRGLSPEEAIPAVFRSAATGAVAAATAIVELLLTDAHIRAGLRGMPSYLHAMTAFACVFLLKIATKRRTDCLVEVSLVSELAGKLVNQFRSVGVGKWHLVHLMAQGLEQAAASLLQDDPGGGGGGGGGGLASRSANDGSNVPAHHGISGHNGHGAAAGSPYGLPHDGAGTPGFSDHNSLGGLNGGMAETPFSFSNNLSPDFVFGGTSFLDFHGGQLDFNYDHLNFP